MDSKTCISSRDLATDAGLSPFVPLYYWLRHYNGGLCEKTTGNAEYLWSMFMMDSNTMPANTKPNYTLSNYHKPKPLLFPKYSFVSV